MVLGLAEVDEELAAVRADIQEGIERTVRLEGIDYGPGRLVHDSHDARSRLADVEPIGPAMPNTERAEVQRDRPNDRPRVDVDEDGLVRTGDRDIEEVAVG